MARERPDQDGFIGDRPNPAESSVVSSPMSAVAADPAAVAAASTSTRRDARGHADFDALFDAHYARLVGALTVVAGDRETAADAVQEAFVKAHLRWRRIGKYDDPVGWVRRVAVNRLRDEHRRSGRKRRALARLAARTEPSRQPDDIDEFGRLLGQLPTRQRVVTALFYVDGLPIAEIATTLEIAEGSVKSALHDARRRLRTVLEAESAHDDDNPPTRGPGR